MVLFDLKTVETTNGLFPHKLVKNLKASERERELSLVDLNNKTKVLNTVSVCQGILLRSELNFDSSLSLNESFFTLLIVVLYLISNFIFIRPEFGIFWNFHLKAN